LAVPLAGIIVLNLSYRGKSSKKIAFYIAAVILLNQIVMSLTMGGFIWRRVDEVLNLKLFVSFNSNIYSPLMLLIIGTVALASLTLDKFLRDSRLFNFSNLILLVVMGMDGVVLVDDLFSLYVFLELTAVSTFILIAIYKEGSALEASFKYLVMSSVATVFMLSAIAFVFMSAGSLKFEDMSRLMADIKDPAALPVIIAVILFSTGLSIKAGIVPFHGWLPDAYTSAPSAVSLLLAGIVSKIAGVYPLLIIFQNVFNKSPIFGNILMVFGTVSIIIGALAALGENDFKRMLAFSSISQIGYIVLGIGIGTQLALMGAVFHFFNHAIFKSLLFVNSAAVEVSAGTRHMDKLGGLASRMPVTGGASIVGFLSTAGIPPLSGFWSKFIIIMAAWQAGQRALAIAALLSSILTLGYFLILQRKVFFGEIPEGLEGACEVNTGIKSISIILSAITIAVGILFPLIFETLKFEGLF
jgi:multicomponent Na+:H+ antiporter subunit D